jgi:protein SCO1
LTLAGANSSANCVFVRSHSRSHHGRGRSVCDLWSAGRRAIQGGRHHRVAWGRGFELNDHNGNKRTLADFRGKVVLVFFGYTGCPDMCPTTLALVAGGMKELGSDAEQVQGLFITVDPKRDTPQVLAQYVPAFYPTFLGLYADQATTERTVRDFKGYFHANAPNEHRSYTVDHSAQVYVFDPAGRIRLYIQPTEATPESVAHDVRLLLREAQG